MHVIVFLVLLILFSCAYCDIRCQQLHVLIVPHPLEQKIHSFHANCYLVHHVKTLQDSSLMNSKMKLCLLVASMGAEDTLAGNPRCIPLVQFPLWPEKNNNLKQNSRPSSDILFHLVIRAQTRFKNISI